MKVFHSPGEENSLLLGLSGKGILTETVKRCKSDYHEETGIMQSLKVSAKLGGKSQKKHPSLEEKPKIKAKSGIN